MPHAKVAITLPKETLARIDMAAEERGESRSGFIRRVLTAALRARRDAEVTQKLNDLFSNEDLARDQSQSARELDSAGTDWSDERWE